MKAFTFTEVEKLFPDATPRAYDTGQIAIYFGDMPNHVMFIKSGAVKIYDSDQEGNEKILHIRGEGGIFPLPYCFGTTDEVEGFYATLCPTELVMIDVEDFQRLLKTKLGYSYRLLKWSADEMDLIITRLKSLANSSAKQKLLGALSYLVDEHSVINSRSRNWFKVNFPVSQQMLADMTGVTRETVNAVLKEADILRIVRTPKKQTLEINKANLSKLNQ